MESGLKYRFFKAVFYPELPSFATAVLIERVFDPQLISHRFLAGISMSGWSLLATMLLSFLQWYLVGWVVVRGLSRKQVGSHGEAGIPLEIPKDFHFLRDACGLSASFSLQRVLIRRFFELRREGSGRRPEVDFSWTSFQGRSALVTWSRSVCRQVGITERNSCRKCECTDEKVLLSCGFCHGDSDVVRMRWRLRQCSAASSASCTNAWIDYGD